MIPFSILDLSPIIEGATPADALRNTLDLAQHAEKWGFRRFWVAEHHNMPGIASAATSVVIGYVSGGTRTIRVGSGGIMLPNHSPPGHYGTIRNPRVALSGPDRPGPRPRSRYRFTHHARFAPRCSYGRR